MQTGTTSDTTVSSGGLELVILGATASNTTVANGGTLDLLMGGTANFTTISGGGFEYVLSGGVAVGDTLDVTFLAVSQGGYALAQEYVGPGATAISTTIGDDGSRGFYWTKDEAPLLPKLDVAG